MTALKSSEIEFLKFLEEKNIVKFIAINQKYPIWGIDVNKDIHRYIGTYPRSLFFPFFNESNTPLKEYMKVTRNWEYEVIKTL